MSSVRDYSNTMAMFSDRVIQDSNPAVFTGLIDSWPSSSWTPSVLAEMLQDKFRCKIAPKYSEDQTWETDCVYVDASLTDFCEWTFGKVKGDNPLGHIPSEDFSCYVDYKYMPEMFVQCQHLLKAVDWSVLGLDGRDGQDSTIWIGSEGASTPCHYDTYGFNLVAQIHGKKRWHLFPPSCTDCLYPTRLPYEESSVFSQVNVQQPNLRTHAKFKDCQGIVVTLEPGQVLYVPRHWWHYVECLETAISINTWVEIPEDNISRVSESMTRAAVSCLMSGQAREGMEDWINPNEDMMSMDVNWTYILNSLQAVLNTPPESAQNSDHTSRLCKFAQHFKRSYKTLVAPWSIPDICNVNSSILLDDASDADHLNNDNSTKSDSDVNVEMVVVEKIDWRLRKRKHSDEGLPCYRDLDSLSGGCSGDKKSLKIDSKTIGVSVKGNDKTIYVLQTGRFDEYYKHANGNDLQNCGKCNVADSRDKGASTRNPKGQGTRQPIIESVRMACLGRQDAALASRISADAKAKMKHLSDSPEDVNCDIAAPCEGCSSDVVDSVVHPASSDVFDSVVHPASSDVVDSVIHPASSDVVDSVIHLSSSDVVNYVVPPASSDVVDSVVHPASSDVVDSVVHPASSDVVDSVIHPSSSDVVNYVDPPASSDVVDSDVPLSSSDVVDSDVPVFHPSSLITIRELFFKSLLSPRVMKLAADELLSMYQSMNK